MKTIGLLLFKMQKALSVTRYKETNHMGAIRRNAINSVITEADVPESMNKKEYSKLAEYYDLTHKSYDYSSQCDLIEKLFKKHFKHGRVKSLLDIGCGTGNQSIIFAKKGYNVIGIDNSTEMLTVAKKKISRHDRNPPKLFKMDMRRISLRDKFEIALVLIGGFGYLVRNQDTTKFFSSIRRVLSNRNSLLIFDFWQKSSVPQEAKSESGYKGWDIFQPDKKANIRIVRL